MNHNDGGFENYRRQRERLRRMASAERRPLSGPANALRELEEVEAREERDRQLTSEMKDFFESATRIAADIVQKVADSAKVRIDEQLSGEMQEFLALGVGTFAEEGKQGSHIELPRSRNHRLV